MSRIITVFTNNTLSSPVTTADLSRGHRFLARHWQWSWYFFSRLFVTRILSNFCFCPEKKAISEVNLSTVPLLRYRGMILLTKKKVSYDSNVFIYIARLRNSKANKNFDGSLLQWKGNLKRSAYLYAYFKINFTLHLLSFIGVKKRAFIRIKHISNCFILWWLTNIILFRTLFILEKPLLFLLYKVVKEVLRQYQNVNVSTNLPRKLPKNNIIIWVGIGLDSWNMCLRKIKPQSKVSSSTRKQACESLT